MKRNMLDAIAEVPQQNNSTEILKTSTGERRAYVDYVPLNPRDMAFFSWKQVLLAADVFSVMERKAGENVPLESTYHVVREVKDYRHTGIKNDFTLEIESLTPDVIVSEEFTKFYTHLTYFAKYGTPEEITPLIPAILQKVQKEKGDFLDAAFPDDQHSRWNMDTRLTLLELSCLQALEERQGFKVSRQTIETIYDSVSKDHPLFMHYAAILDERNRGTDEFVNIEDRFRPIALDAILSDAPSEQVIESLNSLSLNFLTSVFSEVIGLTDAADKLEKIVQIIAPALGIENIRKTLRDMVAKDESTRPKLVQIFNYIGLDPVTGIAVDLEKDVYDKLDFSGYEPNKELLEHETELLKKEFGTDKKILDVACGTGRLLTELDGQQGLQVSGVDLVPKHIEYIKEHYPNKDVQVGSWFGLPYPDKSFDAAYCLGRSITHNTTVPDFVRCLSEMRRVIKDDGFVLLDLPDGNKGDYPELKDRTYRALSQRGFKNHLSGLINDSPDQDHYFDRYVPSAGALTMLAALSGFRITKLTADKSYSGISGKENTNTYWKLEKDEDVGMGQFLFDNPFNPLNNFLDSLMFPKVA